MKTVAQKFAESYIDQAGVVRWISSNNIPFMDMLTDFLVAGLIDQDTVINSDKTRKAEDAKFIAEYVSFRKTNGYSDEELFEMRAAFGAGEQVVDVFTGRTITL